MVYKFLLFPILISIIIGLSRSKLLNNILLTLYAVFHIVFSINLIYCGVQTEQEYFTVDSLNTIFLSVLSIIFFAVSIYNFGYSKNKDFDISSSKKYSIAVILFVLSMTGAILSNDLAVAWIFIEATTLASGYLIYINQTKHAIEASWKYIFMCSIGIALAFVGITLLSVASGSLNSLNYTVLYNHAGLINLFWLKFAFIFILFGIGTKMGLAPVHFWLPDAHAQAPSPISALLSASLLNCAFLIILRMYKLMILTGYGDFAKILLLTMGFLSLFVTAVFLYHINNYKRMLAYSSIENMGILVIGTALGGVGMYAAILHMIGHSLVKGSFFLTAGNILRLYRSKKTEFASNIIKADNKTAWLWVICGLCIVATPPSILFISEILILKQMILGKHFIMLAFFLILLTIIFYGIMKAVTKMSFNEGCQESQEVAKSNKDKIYPCMYIPQILMLTLAIVMGIYMPNFIDSYINQAIIGF